MLPTGGPSQRPEIERGPSSSRPSSSSKSSSAKGKKKGGKKEADKPKDIASSVLYAQAKQRLQDADKAEEKAKDVFSTFERKLGAALKKKGQKIAELLRDWDGEGKGEIKKIAFRQKVRGSLGIKANNSEIDAFFNSMDDDKGGSLDLSELRPALKFLLEAAHGAEAEAVALLELATELRAKAAQTEEAARATEIAEKEEADRAQMKGENGPPDVQLGQLIMKRNLKIGDVITKWDPSGDGSVDKGEFRTNVIAMGVKAEPEAIDELFASLDDDGGGELDVKELKDLLTRLKDTAQQAAAQDAEAEAKAVALRKAASKLQSVLRAEEESKARAEREAKEAADREAAAKAEEEKAALEEKKKAKAMAAMKKQDENTAFEAKIKARRNWKDAVDAVIAEAHEGTAQELTALEA